MGFDIETLLWLVYEDGGWEFLLTSTGDLTQGLTLHYICAET